jgi:methyltransferase-like protein/trans-aconitate methyltransferase
VREASAPGTGRGQITSYDAVPYPGRAFPQAHPNRLATMATLFGMKPAPVERCRVLELGCGDGANLIPMAFGLPHSEFIGIDLAARAITKGQAFVEALGLRNIHLRQLDLVDVTPELGIFDYIIAHGLYSWVPLPVQDKILAICRAHLAPHGVAFVSYNIYPGYHLQGLVRDLMRFHVRMLEDPEERVTQALAFLGFLAESQDEPDTYRTVLKQRLDDLLERPRNSVYHDELAETNLPVYFHQFMAHAGRHGLQFLSESTFSTMQDRAFPERVRQILGAVAHGDILLKEQYLDFLKCRKFRQTLLCHQDVSLNRAVTPEVVMGFFAASPASPVSPQPDIRSPAEEEFRGPFGAAMSTAHPFAKAVIMQLVESWPRLLAFDELLASSRAALGPEAPAGKDGSGGDAFGLANILLATFAAGLVELHVHVPEFVTEISERPVASPLARWQARESTMVTNLRHASIELEGHLVRHLLLLLDGTRDRDAILRDLAAAAAADPAALQEASGLPNDGGDLAQVLAGGLEANLQRVARLALLVA